ncbi:MAG: twin-arginine translocase subunit TatC [Chloroflexi bacterium]|nr:MAG: twin-arginine translocase subunit TatC [Chloroflexota bacterium]
MQPRRRKIIVDELHLTLLEHLGELRWRLLRAAVAVLAGTIAGSFITTPVIKMLVQPLGEGQIVTLSPTEAPLAYFRVALFLGVLLALPYVLYQLYAFAAPGLRSHERALLLVGFPAVLLLFTLGALFTMTVLVPISLPLLMAFLQDVVQPVYSLERYLAFVTTLLLWMGLLFQTPLVLYAAARLGLVKPDALRRARKMVIFLAALAAAIITPTTDPITMLLVTGPFVALYEVGLLLARLAARQRAAFSA